MTDDRSLADQDATLCELCEVQPADGEDPFCPVCRVEVTAMSMVVKDPIEQVLNDHQHLCALSGMESTMCICGEKFDGGPGYHRRHLAALIREAVGLPLGEPWRPAAEGES